MRFNIFRNPTIDAHVGYLLDCMIDARRKETEEYWRGVFEKELDIEYWRGYNDAMVEMYKNIEKDFDELNSFIEDQLIQDDYVQEPLWDDLL